MSLGDATVAGGGSRSRHGIEMLHDGNYSQWKWGCRTLLEEVEIWDVVSGESKRPVKVEGQPENADALAWDKKDKKALAIIGFSVIGRLHRPVRIARSAACEGGLG